jgi:deazaflavin-dependent oxidoreductase (nitroreductase family)
MAVIHHRGRMSGKPFDTPVQAFRTKDGFIVGLAYDSNSNWALNLLAADGGEMSRGGRRYVVSNPHRRSAEARDDLPSAIAFTMRKLDIDDFREFEATRT